MVSTEADAPEDRMSPVSVHSRHRAPAPMDIEAAEGDTRSHTLEAFQLALENKHPVVMVSRSTCGFCRSARDVLTEACGTAIIIETDQAAEGAAILKHAKAVTGHSTVPVIFFHGEFVGGCNDIVAMKDDGTLYTRLRTAPPPRASVVWGAAHETRAPPRRQALGYFPHTVNTVAIRFTALQIVMLAVGICVCYEEDWAGWAALAMAFDFIIRVVGGGYFSPAGSLAQLLAVPFTPQLSPGPPKQFAAMVGVAFALTAALCLLCGEKVAGVCIMAGLAGAASLEAFFGFCAGCVVFGLLTRFGIVSGNVYAVHIDQRPRVRRGLDTVDDFESALKDIESIRIREVGDPHTACDRILKQNKSDNHVRRSFHPVKYVTVGDNMIPLGVAGLALAFRAARPQFYDTHALWHALAYISVGVFAVLNVLLFAKVVMFPRKVWGELTHPVKSNFCTAWPIVLSVYSILLEPGGDDDLARLQKAFFWIAAGLLKLMLVWKAAQLVGARGSDEVVTPALLLPIGGCLVAAMNATAWPDLAEVAWFLFGLPAVLSLLLVGTTFTASITYHWSDERVRAALALWPTVLHLMYLAYTSLTVVSFAPGVPAAPRPANVMRGDAFAHTLFYAGWSLSLVLLWLALPMGFLFRLKFDMSFWAFAFAADILAAASITFDHTAPPADDVRYLGEYLGYATLFIACWTNAVLIFQTVYALLKRRWLRATYKWGPQSFNKLTHTALQESGDHLLALAADLKARAATNVLNEGELDALVKQLAAQLRLHLVVLDWHSVMEDTILFRVVDSFHPLLTKDAYLQHDALHRMEEKALALCEAVLNGSAVPAQAIEDLHALLAVMVPYSNRHMEWEEENLNGILRKDVNIPIQKAILRRVWNTYAAVSMEELKGGAGGAHQGGWDRYHLAKLARGECAYPTHEDIERYFAFPPTHPDAPMPVEKQQIFRVMLPWVVNWLPIPMQRTRFIKALVWAVPEHAQQIGDMVYRGVSDAAWAVLATDVPEVVPRGLPGWTRYV